LDEQPLYLQSRRFILLLDELNRSFEGSSLDMFIAIYHEAVKQSIVLASDLDLAIDWVADIKNLRPDLHRFYSQRAQRLPLKKSSKAAAAAAVIDGRNGRAYQTKAVDKTGQPLPSN
jgi:hypothetical protein